MIKRTAWNKGIKTGISYWRGKKLSKTHCKKLSLAKQNYIPWNKGLKGGQVAWNKGKKLSKEQCRKMSLSHIGKTAWNKGIKYLQITGEKNHRWKGGKTKEIAKLRYSIEYKKWKNSIFKRDKNKCQICGSKNNIHAHYIKPIVTHKRLIFYIKNGITLCSVHHKSIEGSNLAFYFEKLFFNKIAA
tara:strand:+ start:706 stop:1263 length:558 start_codon:yes stop_codon:yes gene_type:complete